MINFTHTPPAFSPVYTDGLYFIVSADTNHFKFRYTYNIYVDGNFVFEGKATPNPFGLGVIDVSRILKTYVANNPISYWNTTPIYTHQTFPFSRPALDETINYEVLVGYEYASSEIAQVTGFTGNSPIDIPGPPTATEGLFKTFQSTMGVNGRANEQDFNIDPFVLSGTPVGTNPTTSGLFLTNSPRIRDIQPTEYYTLGFTNYYLSSSMLSEPYYVQYKFYDDSGTLLDTQTYENITTNGGGPLPNCTYVYPSWYLIEPTGSTEYNTLYVGAGPKNLEDVIPADTAQYTVQLFGKFTGSTTPVQPTPTPTPSSTPPAPIECSGSCANYTVSNPNLSACEFTYFSCSAQRNITISIPAQTSTIVSCVCSTSLVYECDLDIDFYSNCTGAPCSTCFQFIVTNDSDRGPVTYYYYDCELGYWTGRTQPAETGALIDCACNTFYSDELSALTITINAICGQEPQTTPTPTPTIGTTATPTPTRTSTPTPTPTCSGYKSWGITTGTTSCSGGICTLGSPTFATVYTNCNVTSLTAPSTDIFTDTSLTTSFVGFFSRGGSIWYSDGTSVTEECVIGGPC